MRITGKEHKKMSKSIRRFGSEIILCLFLLVIYYSCQENSPPPKPIEIVKVPELLNPKTTELIKGTLNYAALNNGKIDNYVALGEASILQFFYPDGSSKRLWSDEQTWLPIADSLFLFVERSEQYGLFPNDYHYASLRTLRERLHDSASKLDAALWSRGDLMLSDAFVQIAKHLKRGRLEKDSTTLSADTILTADFYTTLFTEIQNGQGLTSALESVEPAHNGYQALRHALPAFLDTMDRTSYTYLRFPYDDSLVFTRQLQSRLFESSYITFNTRTADSTELKEAIKRAQEDRNLKVDGKFGPLLVKSLNNTDVEKFKIIAINLDRYKLLPSEMPEKYIWVNLPEFKMQVREPDSIILDSKIIVGQPKTRTPVLTSAVTNFITYPQWTVPFSIVIKEMLPQIQKDTLYLNKQNLMVVDKNDSVIEPATINWSKLSKKYFPYNLRQRQGDDNSLGVMKFNFRNKYEVYLHDTNARGLFSRNNRALSHGCVRVQQWKKLALYLSQNDSLRYPRDTIAAWLKRQEKHTVSLSEKVPVYLRYFTCIAEDGKIRFFDDIYAEDKLLRERYFAGK
jgi:L,D-transpeptidase YcbB